MFTLLFLSPAASAPNVQNALKAVSTSKSIASSATGGRQSPAGNTDNDEESGENIACLSPKPPRRSNLPNQSSTKAPTPSAAAAASAAVSPPNVSSSSSSPTTSILKSSKPPTPKQQLPAAPQATANTRPIALATKFDSLEVKYRLKKNFFFYRQQQHQQQLIAVLSNNRR